MIMNLNINTLNHNFNKNTNKKTFKDFNLSEGSFVRYVLPKNDL